MNVSVSLLNEVDSDSEPLTQQLSASVVIPLRNGMPYAERLIRGLNRQTVPAKQIIILDSESTDGSAEHFCAAGFTVVPVAKESFDHGATRNVGWRLCETDIVVFLTQDALPYDRQCFAHLIGQFEQQPSIGIVSGRQLPRIEARTIERHGRLFNYPRTSNYRILADADAMGFKILSNSNSFSAYRRSMLEAIGGFPERVIMGEDHIAVALALMKGWTVVYDSAASVEHSHGYSLTEEFRRYFDIGVSHKDHSAIYKLFAKPNGDGKRFVLSELRYLWRHRLPQIPEAFIRTALKLVAYRLGHREQLLPNFIRDRVAMHPQYFAKRPSGVLDPVVNIPMSDLADGETCES